jgi:hypothetical protein
VPRAPRRRTVDQALKRMSSLAAQLPDEAAKAKFDEGIQELQAAVSAALSEQRVLAERLSQQESSIAELQARSAELAQANANQARLLGALTQPSGQAGGAQAGLTPIAVPLTLRPSIVIEPSIIPTTGPVDGPTPSPSPSPSPSPGPGGVTPVAIASAFQQAFSAIQAPPGTGGPALKSMDVQIKGLVQVAEDGSQTTLQFPTLDQPLTGDVLSTVSMSLGAVPEIAPTKPPG